MTTSPESPKKEINDEKLTPEELMKKHLTDPNHVITDDEFAKLKVGIDAEDETEINKEVEEKSEERENPQRGHAVPDTYGIIDND